MRSLALANFQLLSQRVPSNIWIGTNHDAGRCDLIFVWFVVTESRVRICTGRHERSVNCHHPEIGNATDQAESILGYTPHAIVPELDRAIAELAGCLSTCCCEAEQCRPALKFAVRWGTPPEHTDRRDSIGSNAARIRRASWEASSMREPELNLTVDCRSLMSQLQGPILVLGASGFVGANLLRSLWDVRPDMIGTTTGDPAWRLHGMPEQHVRVIDANDIFQSERLLDEVCLRAMCRKRPSHIELRTTQ